MPDNRPNTPRPSSRPREIGRSIDRTQCHCGDADCDPCMEWLDNLDDDE